MFHGTGGKWWIERAQISGPHIVEKIIFDTLGNRDYRVWNYSLLTLDVQHEWALTGKAGSPPGTNAP